MKAGTLSIAHTRVEKTKAIGEPKKERGRRTLPLDSGLTALLSETKRTQGAIAGFVVLGADGQPIRPERYPDLWRALLGPPEFEPSSPGRPTGVCEGDEGAGHPGSSWRRATVTMSQS